MKGDWQKKPLFGGIGWRDGRTQWVATQLVEQSAIVLTRFLDPFVTFNRSLSYVEMEMIGYPPDLEALERRLKVDLLEYGITIKRTEKEQVA